VATATATSQLNETQLRDPIADLETL